MRETIRSLCSDRNPATRLRAAKELGIGGHDILMELAHGLEDDAVSAEAVSILDRELSGTSVEALFKRSETRRIKTAIACLEVMGRRGSIEIYPLAMAARGHGELAAAAIRALEATGSPEAESPLIKALQHEEAKIRMAAAGALGRMGSISAVLPLKEAAKRFGRDLGLGQAVRQAIAEIQSRVEGASPGQLSLAGAETGQLSLAHGEAGQLSIAEDPAGQLSLPPGERPA